MNKLELILLGLLSFTHACSVTSNREIKSNESDQIGIQYFDLEHKTPEERFQLAMTAIMKYHEGRLKIRYPERALEIRFEIPGDIHPMDRDSFCGSYDEEGNYFYFNPRYRDCDITQLLNPENIAKGDRYSDCDSASLCSILSHELGHYFVDCLIETEFPDSWLQAHLKNREKLGVDDFGLFIVREGIGTYFENLFDLNFNLRFTDKEWTSEWERRDFLLPSVREWFNYGGGYNLVKPIIDKFDVNGIIYLASHELRLEIPNVEPALLYRENAMKDLEGKKGDFNK